MELTNREAVALGKALIEESYTFFTEPTPPDFHPEGISPYYSDKMFSAIFGDPGAVQVSYYIRFTADEKTLAIPIAVYGRTLKYKMRYSFNMGITNHLIRISLAQFSRFFRGEDESHIQEYYQSVLAVKESLTRNILSHYYQLEDGCEPVLSWNVLPEKSKTRTIVENISYHRTEAEKPRFEIYSKHELSQTAKNYIIECDARMGSGYLSWEKSSRMQQYLRLPYVLYCKQRIKKRAAILYSTLSEAPRSTNKIHEKHAQ